MEQLANPARRSLLRGRIAKATVTPKLRLPWVKSEAAFIDQCTQCNDCISRCETNIIVKDEFGYPRVDFSKGECTFCQQCVDSCEQPLFIDKSDFKDKLAWPATIAIADNCLAANQVYCQSCQDECEPRAIAFKFVETSVPVPSINLDDCTLCGACVSKCPQSAIKIAKIEDVVNVG